MRKTTPEKLADIREKILKMQNEEKQLVQQHKAEERKARTRRFCSRHGLLEKFMPDLAVITDEQFESFIKIVIANSHGREKLAKIMATPTTYAPSQNGNTPVQPNSTNNANPTQAPTHNNTNPNANHAKPAQQTHAAEQDKSGGNPMARG